MENFFLCPEKCSICKEERKFADFKILISFGETQYSNIFTDFPNTKSNFITYLKTVGYDSVVKIIMDIHAADKQNLDVNAKAFIITLNLVVDEKYVIVMPNDVTR